MRPASELGAPARRAPLSALGLASALLGLAGCAPVPDGAPEPRAERPAGERPSDPRRAVAAVREAIVPGLTLDELAERLGPPDRELGSATRVQAWDLADGTVLVAAQSPAAAAIEYAARVEFARRDGRGMTKIGAELERLVPR